MSLFCPPPYWPAILAPFWPWIWMQVLILRAYVRRTYGAGTPFQWGLDRFGRVILLQVIPKGSEPEWAKPVSSFDRLKAATDGRLFTPEYAACAPLSLGRGAGVRGHGVSARIAHAAARLPLIPNPFSQGRRGLPLPET
jgi:hypothetical protein